MDSLQVEVIKVFIRLLYSVDDSATEVTQLPKDQQKQVKKLINEAKKLLRKLHMQMSLAKIESQGDLSESDHNNS